MAIHNADQVVDKVLELVNGFDFDRCFLMMRAVGWKWAIGNEYRTPTIEEMKDKCFGLLLEADRKQTVTATGGFEARYAKKDGCVTLELRFIGYRSWADYEA
jgi:hypothetical protein